MAGFNYLIYEVVHIFGRDPELLRYGNKLLHCFDRIRAGHIHY